MPYFNIQIVYRMLGFVMSQSVTVRVEVGVTISMVVVMFIIIYIYIELRLSISRRIQNSGWTVSFQVSQQQSRLVGRQSSHVLEIAYQHRIWNKLREKMDVKRWPVAATSSKIFVGSNSR